MNRKSFIAAAAAVLVSFGLAAAPEAEANGKGKNRAPNLVEVAIAANTSGPFAGAFDTLIAAVLAADVTRTACSVAGSCARCRVAS